jgi:hypothetical protein
MFSPLLKFAMARASAMHQHMHTWNGPRVLLAACCGSCSCRRGGRRYGCRRDGGATAAAADGAMTAARQRTAQCVAEGAACNGRRDDNHCGVMLLTKPDGVLVTDASTSSLQRRRRLPSTFADVCSERHGVRRRRRRRGDVQNMR